MLVLVEIIIGKIDKIGGKGYGRFGARISLTGIDQIYESGGCIYG